MRPGKNSKRSLTSIKFWVHESKKNSQQQKHEYKCKDITENMVKCYVYQLSRSVDQLQFDRLHIQIYKHIKLIIGYKIYVHVQ